MLGALHNANEVVHKDIHMCNGSFVPCERGLIIGLWQRLCELYEL